ISVSAEFSLGTAGTATLTMENGGTFITGTGLTTVNATGDLNINAGGTMIVRGNMTVLSSLDIANGSTVILDANAPPAPASDEFAEPELGAPGVPDFGAWEDSNASTGASVGVVPEP